MGYFIKSLWPSLENLKLIQFVAPCENSPKHVGYLLREMYDLTGNAFYLYFLSSCKIFSKESYFAAKVLYLLIQFDQFLLEQIAFKFSKSKYIQRPKNCLSFKSGRFENQLEYILIKNSLDNDFASLKLLNLKWYFGLPTFGTIKLCVFSFMYKDFKIVKRYFSIL